MIEEGVTGLAVAGLVGASLRRLRQRHSEAAGPIESRLGEAGQGVGHALGSGLRTGVDLSAGVARLAGRAGAAGIEWTVPAAASGAGLLLDGVTAVVTGTGRGTTAVLSRLSPLPRHHQPAPGADVPGDAAPAASPVPPATEQPPTAAPVTPAAVPADAAAAAAPTVEPAAPAEPAQAGEVAGPVARAGGGTRFHRPECRMVTGPVDLMAREEAEAEGLAPCGICRP